MENRAYKKLASSTRTGEIYSNVCRKRYYRTSAGFSGWEQTQGIVNIIRDDLFKTYFICFPKVAGHGQNRSKMIIVKRGVDGFSYFSLISIILFSKQDHPCVMKENENEFKSTGISSVFESNR